VRWAQRTEGDLRAGRHLSFNEARRRTVTELLDRYRTEVLPQYSRREQAQRLGKLGWWGRQLGALRLADLSAASISKSLARLALGEGLSGRPASAATQTRYLATIKHVLAGADEVFVGSREGAAFPRKAWEDAVDYLRKLRKKATEAVAIKIVIIMASTLAGREVKYLPIIFLLLEIKMISTSNGGASMAFSAAA
jgi:hypothetical protein